MVVQTGEGIVDIIFHEASVPAGARTLGGYIARPDALGQWPTVMVFGPERMPTSAIKHICRVLARHGIAAFAPDLTESATSNRSISRAVSAYFQNPASHWSNAEYGFGVLAFGKGLGDAAVFAATDPAVDAWVAIGSNVDDEAVGNLAESETDGLVIISRADESVDVDASVANKDTLVRATFVVYKTGDEGFWNDSAAGYDEARATDALDRAIAFFGMNLPARV